MKNKILEVQDYFIQKIVKREYELIKSELQNDVWLDVEFKIDDEFYFFFSSKNRSLCVHQSPILFTDDQKLLIISSLEYLLKDAKDDFIKKMNDIIAEL